jgi:hypothetical protein
MLPVEQHIVFDVKLDIKGAHMLVTPVAIAQQARTLAWLPSAAEHSAECMRSNP